MKIKQIAQEDEENATGEYTDVELTRIDVVHNSINELINDLNPKGTEVPWDMEIIGDITDLIEEYFVARGICTAREFIPYRDQE